MKKIVSLLIGGAVAATFAMAQEHTIHWGYSGHGGPEHWGELSKDYQMCLIGKNQSPIDIRTKSAFETKLPAIQFDYHTSAKDVVDNGHTEQVDLEPGSFITIDGRKFELKQFHFHTPSENRIDGQSFPLEAHFVHADEHGNLAVVALMFTYGKANPVLAKVWENMPEHAGEKHHFTLSSEDVMKLLPKNRDYYRFNGSLTTPPCTEGVRWFVIKEPVTISKEQVQKFAKIMHHNNNRPVQPLNSRMVLK
jgi:carbonic anhydrase